MKRAYGMSISGLSAPIAAGRLGKLRTCVEQPSNACFCDRKIATGISECGTALKLS